MGAFDSPGNHYAHSERGSAAEHRAGCFDVGAGVKKIVEHRDVAAAGRPAQRCFGVAVEAAVGINVRTGSDEPGDHRRTIREFARPIGRGVQQSSVAAGIAEPCGGEPRVVIEQRVQPLSLDKKVCQ